jgi:hypothetical protein
LVSPDAIAMDVGSTFAAGAKTAAGAKPSVAAAAAAGAGFALRTRLLLMFMAPKFPRPATATLPP